MKWLADRIMRRRAKQLARRLLPHFRAGGKVADIGSGTGHNAIAFENLARIDVRQFDVADLHWIGSPPTIIAAGRVPSDDNTFDTALLLFVLQYPEEPLKLLCEARRIARGSVILVQSTCHGRRGRWTLAIREFFWGRFAYRLAKLLRLVAAEECPLIPQRAFTRQELHDLIKSAGLKIHAAQHAAWPGLGVSRDLFVLTPDELTDSDRP